MKEDQTVRLNAAEVPAGFADVFKMAQEYVEDYFSDRIEDPRKANIEIRNDRYVLIRAASMAVDFFETVKNLYLDEGEEKARNVAWSMLYDVAHSIGRADARNFHEKMNLKEPLEKLSAGPLHFAHAGWAFVRILPESRPSPDDSYFLVYDHPYSFESHSWVQRGKKSDHPVCVMNAGYSSGWCAESFGLELVATEIMCRAKGDDQCRFVMASPSRIEMHLRGYLDQTPDLAHRVSTFQIPGFFHRKKLEEDRDRAIAELRKARDELESRVRERTVDLERANLALVQEMAERKQMEEEIFKTRQLESLGVLAGGLAHDFNNVLTGILGNISMARNYGSAGEQQQKRLKEAENACQHAKLLANRLLTFSKGGAPVTEVSSISALIRQTVDFSLSGSNALAICDFPDDIWPARIDRGQIGQVINNLVMNAQQAMPDGGTIRIEARNKYVGPDEVPQLDEGSYVKISVQDEGLGIPEDVMLSIFDPYFTRKPGGTGLGLTLALSIVVNHNGTIIVDSPPGSGANFAIYLPACPGDPPAVARREDILPTGAGRILVMDDSDIIVAVADAILRRLGYTPEFARDGAIAIELYREALNKSEPYDAVILDLTIPGGMGGKEAIKGILALDPRARVIMATGYTDDPIMSSYLEHGFSGAIPKPFDLLDLGTELKRVLGLPRDP